MEYIVEKRDGSHVGFNIDKICSAIEKAFASVQSSWDDSIIQLLALHVTSDFEHKVIGGIIRVEDIQDSVEKVLSQSGYYDVAKAYILYRKQRENIRIITNNASDYTNLINSYLNNPSFHEQDDTDMKYSVGGMMLNNSGAITSHYWLSEVYDHEVSQAHRNGDFHIHDLNMLTGYSAGWSIEQIITEGLGGVSGMISSRKPKHLATLCNQLVNFLGIMQNEWAGAQSLSHFDTLLAPFVRVDHLTYEEVKQCVETFVYGVNTPSRWGTQAPFSNVSFDWTIPSEFMNRKALTNQNTSFTYGDCLDEMKMIQQAFFEIMYDADLSGRGFQFPIPTIEIGEDTVWDDSLACQYLFGSTAKYGTPYFSRRKPNKYKKFDEDVLAKDTRGYFGYGDNEGSIGIVTLNMPRLAYYSKDEDDFFVRLSALCDLAARCLDEKRSVLNQFLEVGLYPYTKRYVQSFDTFYSSIGIIGMNEACLNASWLQEDLQEEKAQQFTLRVLCFLKDKLLDYQKKYKVPFNLEATPAEGVSHRFAQLDQQDLPNVQTAALMNGDPYYTNSSHLSVHATDDLFKALDIQSMFQNEYTAGTIFPVYLEQGLSNWKSAKNLVNTILRAYKNIPTFALTPTYSICQTHGYIEGKQIECPICHAKTEIWSRISGYYRPVQAWNKGKKQEFIDRKEYEV